MKLALFDFDGTISERDSLPDFIVFAVGRWRFVGGLFWLSPVLLAYLLKLIPNHRAKQKLLAHFFAGWSIQQFKQVASDYAVTRLPQIIRPKALKCIRQHLQSGDAVWVVSASPENWLQDWCQSLGIGLLATRLEVDGERLTGKFDGKNCHGEEKVARIKAQLSLESFSSIYAYGDSSGDLAMFKLADQHFYKPFR